jgi:hypothetical protein
MKHFLVSTLVACAVLSVVGLAPAGGSATVQYIPTTQGAAPPLQRAVRYIPAAHSPAPRLRMAVRHIPIYHSPAPPLRTIEISNRNPTPTIVPPTASACVGCSQNPQANCVSCPPNSQTVQINLVQVPL